MKPPNLNSTPPTTTSDQVVTAAAQQPAPQQQPQPPTTVAAQQQPALIISNQASNNTNSNQVDTAPIITVQPSIVAKQQVINTPQEQQAPLALTTTQSSQNKTQLQQTMTTQVQQQPPQIAPNTTQSQINQQAVTQIQSRIQPNQIQATATTIATQPGQPITLATASTTTGPTALVIIPQHSTTTSITPAKNTSITTRTNPIPTTMTTAGAVATGHVAMTTTAQSPAIQMQAPVTTIVPTLTPVPMTAHQQSPALTQTTLVNRPPQTLPIVPITTPSNIKQEPNKYICCLLDNGIRCDRIAGNASFSARIQKIVGTKKMNFALDPTVRHAYICDHHKAIITVAKKSTPLVRDTKANARNYTATNNANAVPQHNNSFNEMTINQATLQHPMNLELLSNQSRLVNNHAGVVNNMPIRPGAQLAYGHFAGPHPNQVGSVDVMMAGNFDNAGGDSIPSSSGGVEVDLQQLQVNTLRRYKRHFRVQTRPGLNKMQLAESLKSHFRTLPIIEKEAITYFVYIVKCYRNKLDLPNPKGD